LIIKTNNGDNFTFHNRESTKSKRNSVCIIEKVGHNGKEVSHDQVEDNEDYGIIGSFINFLVRNFKC